MHDLLAGPTSSHGTLYERLDVIEALLGEIASRLEAIERRLDAD